MCPYYLYYLVGRHVSVPYRTIIRSVRAKICILALKDLMMVR